MKRQIPYQKAGTDSRYFPPRRATVMIAVIAALFLSFAQAADAATVNIDLNTTNQTIRGFGGMNFPRWTSGGLTNAQVDTAFGNGSGQIGMTILRIDVPPSTSYWSGEVSAAVRAKSHGAIILASPWSPPASMKTNGSLIQGELKTDSYDDYADYLTDFANYMSSNGASLYAISLQNEPDWLPDYESCGWSPTQMQNFLNNNASVIPTLVLAPETVHYKSDYVSAVASSSECDIVGVHLYGGSAPYYSGKEYWQTEHYTDSSNDADLWPNALNVGKEIHDCMIANMNAYIWWYIRRFYGPIAEDGHVTKRGYCMSHFAKFARPGYARVDATASPSSGVYVTAYTSGDTLVIVAVNQNSSSSDVTFSLSGGSVNNYTKYLTDSSNSLTNMGSVGNNNILAANSINTFVGTIGGGTPDTTPPTPDPMTWSSFPTATGPSTITMTASTATDANSSPVQYYFECTNDGNKSSSWQSSTTYAAEGLDPFTLYSFKVRARDGAVIPNVTGWSSTESATTDPPTTDVTILGSWVSGTSHIKEPGCKKRALIFIVHSEDTSSMALNWVSYGGQGMTKVVDRNYSYSGDYAYTAAYILDEAGIAAAGNGTFIVSWNGTVPSAYGYSSAFLSNVDQTDPVGASANNGSLGTTITTAALATRDGDMVIDAATNNYPGSYTLNNGFIEDIEQILGADELTGVAGHKSATGASETPSATHSVYAVQTIVGLVIKAAPGPAAPTGLSATAGSGTIWLDWNDNNEPDLTGYNVYRSMTSGDDYDKLNGPLVTLSEYADDTVAVGIPYYYVVTAVDTNDDESCYSNEDSAITTYGDCDDVQAGGDGLASDFDGDCYVDYWDLDTVAFYWLSTDCAAPDNCGGADFEPADGDVDFFDFSGFAEQWLQCNDPENPDCPPNW